VCWQKLYRQTEWEGAESAGEQAGLRIERVSRNTIMFTMPKLYHSEIGQRSGGGGWVHKVRAI
jgi:hypothetical protein